MLGAEENAMIRLPILLAGLALAACAAQPALPTATLPRDAFDGIGDPTRSAVFETAYAFRGRTAVAGDPARFARVAGEVEYLAAELPYASRWVQFSPLVGQELIAARDELRAALGISADAPPQVVVELLFAAARALAAGDDAAAQRALLPPIFPDPAATLARLRQPPALPRTGTATALANAEMNRIDLDGARDNGGGDGKGS